MMRLPLVVGLVALLSCGSATEPGSPQRALRVLFVGNSLTYYNDLPTMVKAIAAADGRELITKAVTQGGYGLQDHWQQGVAQEEIAEGNWDLVVLQQGPSSLEASRQDLLYWAGEFDALAESHGACVAFYMVWPDANNPGAFPAIYNHYKEAADSTGGQFLPSGRAWQLAWVADRTVPFYGPDNFHPSPLGTYTAALVIAAGITGKDPTTNTAVVTGVTASGSHWSTARTAARDALVGIPRRCVD